MSVVDWVLVFCVTLLPAATQTLNSSSDETLNLFQSTLYIVSEHISKLSSTVVILEHHIREDTTRINIDLIDYLLPRIGETISVQLSPATEEDSQPNFYVFILDFYDAFKFIRLPVNFEGGNFYYLIILTQYPSNGDLWKIFYICFAEEVLDVNIILNHPTLGTCMYTYELYSKDACEIIQPVLYYRFNHGYEDLKDIFPDKLKNFHGCPLRVAARILEPMIRFEGNISNPMPIGYWENLSGIEGLLLKQIALVLNFTINLLPFEKEWSYVYKDMSAYTTLVELQRYEADIAIGGFCSSESREVFHSVTMQYYHSPYVYVVRGARGLSSLGRLAKPFRHNLWILLTTLLICGVIAIQILRLMSPSLRRSVFGERNSAPVTNLLALALGYSIAQSPRGTLARYLLMLWLFVTFIIRNAYQAALYDAIRTNKFMKIPSGYDDLIDWNYKVLLSPEIQQFTHLFKNQTVLLESDGLVERLQFLERTEGNYATITLKDYYMHYMGTMYQTGSDLLMIDEEILMCQICMYVRKRSMYLKVLNKKLQAFSYSGIIGYIRFNVNNERFIKRQNPLRMRITNERIKAIYEIYTVMVTLAIAVFCVELASIYFARLRTIIEWIN